MPAARHFNIGIMQSTGNAFKKITYDYDLISGKVNNVSYQPGTYDQFYHRYEYDAENRITKVHTSGDGVIWETDARYYYYRHGPLARTETGDLLVQGTDYAYTLQGWLKGVNSSALDPTHDMGEDGSSTSIVAKDVYGFALHYYNTDYAQINTTKNVFATVNTTVLAGFKPLFNGNIAAMAVNIGQFDRPLIYNYGYDQLNRLVAMDAYTGLNSSTNAWTPVSTDDYKERISYDGNGNILAYLRNGTTLNSRPQTMDELTYGYNLDGSGRLLNNRLRHVKDAVSAGNYTTDIDDQGDDNYAYDEIGNLISDDQEGISEISWNVYGKISSITKSGPVTISYDYDASGNRIGKTVGNKHTWYVRDASGNVMAVYEDENSSINSGALSQIEVHLYGSARLGMWQANRDVENWPTADAISLTGLSEGGVRVKQVRGAKIFELSNHLGNVLVTISDRRVEHNTSGTSIDYYEASVVSASDYYPFGMGMPERKVAASGYRYGFNGKENDNEVKGEGNQQDYGMRIYDPRMGKFLSVDPLEDDYPWNSHYSFAEGDPINYIDLDGAERGNPARPGRGRGTPVNGRGPRTPGGQAGAHVGRMLRRGLQRQREIANARHLRNMRTNPSYREAHNNTQNLVNRLNNSIQKETYWQNVLASARITFLGGQNVRTNHDNGAAWDDLVYKAMLRNPDYIGVARQVSFKITGKIDGKELVANIRVDNVGIRKNPITGKPILDFKEAKFSINNITINNVLQTLTPQQRTAADILINGVQVKIFLRGKGSTDKINSILQNDKDMNIQFQNRSEVTGNIGEISIVVPNNNGGNNSQSSTQTPRTNNQNP